MGIPVAPRNIFPSNIQGLPTWFEVRVNEKGWRGRRGGVDLMVAMNPQTWDQDIKEIEPGGYLFYDSTKPLPASKFRDDITVIGMPLTGICNREYTDARQRQLFKNIKVEVELGFDAAQAFAEAQRCLNCDVQTVFAPKLCIECDACVDICPMDCITFTRDGDEQELRARLNAPSRNMTQDLYVAGGLKTGRVMVKDEDVCLHCGLCAERCPTGAWDMQKFFLEPAQAHDCHRRAPAVVQPARRPVLGEAAG